MQTNIRNYLLLFLVAVSFSGFAQQAGYFNMDTIIACSPQSAALQLRLADYRKQLEDSAEVLQNKYAHFLQHGIPDEGNMTEEIEDSLQAKINRMSNDVELFQTTATESYNLLKISSDTTFQTYIKLKAAEFCKNNQLAFFAEKKTILFPADLPDYTSEFLDCLNRDAKK